MADLKLVESGNGGDFVLIAGRGDLEVIYGVQNLPYLGMFGGNKEQSTQIINEGEQRFDYWANELFMNNNSAIQYNSELERVLTEVALTSSGLTLIKQAVETDVSFMKEFSTVSVDVTLTNVDRVQIVIQIKEPDNLESNQFIYVWDSTKKELKFIEQ